MAELGQAKRLSILDRLSSLRHLAIVTAQNRGFAGHRDAWVVYVNVEMQIERPEGFCAQKESPKTKLDATEMSSE